jgi:hypothetical protein
MLEKDREGLNNYEIGKHDVLTALVVDEAGGVVVEGRSLAIGVVLSCGHKVNM